MVLVYILFLVLYVYHTYFKKLFFLENCKKFVLRYNGKIVAAVSDPEIYEHRKEERVARQFGTTNKNHPYIKVFIYILGRKKNISSKNYYFNIFLNL